MKTHLLTTFGGALTLMGAMTLGAATVTVLPGCDNNDAEDLADDIGDAAHDAGDAIGDAVDDAADGVEDATN